MLGKQLAPYLSRFSLLLSGFVALYLTALYMGPYQRGVIASVTALVSLVSTLGGLSIGRTIIFEIEKQKLNPLDYFRENIFSIFLLILTLIIFSVSISFVFFNFYPKSTESIPTLILVGSFFTLPYFMWSAYSAFIFSALDKLYFQSKLVVINETTYIFALFIFFYFSKEVVSFILLTAFFRSISVILEVFFLVKIIQPKLVIKLNAIKKVFINGLSLHLDSISGFFIGAVNVLIVNHFLNKESVGQYDLAMRMATIFLTVPVVSQIFISGHIARLGLRGAWDLIHKNILKTILVVLVFIVAFFLVGNFFMGLIFGEKYSEATYNIKLLTPYIIFNSMCILFSPFFLSKGYFKTASFLTLLLGTLNLSLGYFLIPKFGMVGMTYATDLVYTIAFLINIFYYIKIKNQVFIDAK
jgi:O-antigen/teichoic acid export membrane protein